MKNDLENQLENINNIKANFNKAQKRNLYFMLVLEIIIIFVTYIFFADGYIYISFLLCFLISFTLIHYQKTSSKFLIKMFNEQKDLIASNHEVIKVHNKFRCKELLSSKSKNYSNKSPAIIILEVSSFDNDGNYLDYDEDYEFIRSFGYILLDVSVGYITPPFIGHHTDIEFILYFEDIVNEDEIETYLNKLTAVVETFNKNETRFQLSYVKVTLPFQQI